VPEDFGGMLSVVMLISVDGQRQYVAMKGIVGCCWKE
jgi:hypothetical protein